MEEFKVTKEIKENNGIIKIVHTFSILNFSKVKRILHELLTDDEIKNIIFDLETLDYIDSSGIAVIFEAKKVCPNNRNVIIVGDLKESVYTILENTGVFNIISYKKKREEII